MDDEEGGEEEEGDEEELLEKLRDITSIFEAKNDDYLALEERYTQCKKVQPHSTVYNHRAAQLLGQLHVLQSLCSPLHPSLPRRMLKRVARS